MENQNTEDEWFRKSMETLLQSVGSSYMQAYSISIVPEEIKKSSINDVYLPRMVSIGPRYKGSREELLRMEEIKLRCMLSLFHRAGKKGDAVQFFGTCSEALWKLNDQIQASYVDDINLDRHQLRKVMFVDGCFLLELMISKGLEHELPSRLADHMNPAHEVLQNDDVFSDLILFENQIPIFVLHTLSEILFPTFFGGDFKQTATRINNLALSILGYSLSPSQIQRLNVESPHLLDVVHSFVNNNNNNDNDCDVIVLDVDLDGTGTQRVNGMELKLKRCASRLEAAGVSIQLAGQYKHRSTISCFGLIMNYFGGMLIRLGNMILKKKKIDMLVEERVRGLNFDFKFKRGKFEFAPLHITKTTKTKWRNVIAWEHHKMEWKKTSSNKGRNQNNMISTTCGKFTSAALIFNDLICCSGDVKLLKDRDIIVDHLKMNNKELKEFFHTMTFGVDHRIVGSGYVNMVDELNNYYTMFFPIRFWKTLCHIFTYRLEWFFKFFKRDYNFVAAVLAILTVVQTVYAIMAYHVSK